MPALTFDDLTADAPSGALTFDDLTADAPSGAVSFEDLHGDELPHGAIEGTLSPEINQGVAPFDPTQSFAPVEPPTLDFGASKLGAFPELDQSEALANAMRPAPPAPAAPFSGPNPKHIQDIIDRQANFREFTKPGIMDVLRGDIGEIRDMFDPLIGPSEAGAVRQSVRWGKNPDGSDKYEYKPLGSKFDQQGILMARPVDIGKFKPDHSDSASMAAGKSLFNTAAGFVEFGLSPIGLGTMALPAIGAGAKSAAGLAPAGLGAGSEALTGIGKFIHGSQKAISGGFAVDMLGGVTTQLKAAQNAETPQESIEGWLGVFTGLGFGLAAVGHALPGREITPAIAREIVQRAPDDALGIVKTHAETEGFPVPELVDAELKRRAAKALAPLPKADEVAAAGLPATAEAIRAKDETATAKRAATAAVVKQAEPVSEPAPPPEPGVHGAEAEFLGTEPATTAPSTESPPRKQSKPEPQSTDTTEVPSTQSEPGPPETQMDGLPIIEAPISQLTLSRDVPQFKSGADKNGVVEPLTGRFDRVLDAELNIRDGQGSTADYASYFKHSELSEADAHERGLLARAKGQAGFRVNLPTLRRGERQGDLLSRQAEDLSLVGETGTDTVRAVTEKTTTRPPASPPVAAGSESPTSIKNAVVDAERAKRGLSPAMESTRRAFGTVWDDTMRRIDTNSDAPRNLVDELEKQTRPLTDTEDAMLLHRQLTLQHEFAAAARDGISAADAGDTTRAEEIRLRTALLSDELLRVYRVGKSAGTENGRGLNARKMMAAEDYTLASMVTRKRAANGGKPLSPEVQAELELQHSELQKATDAAAAVAAKADETAATQTATAAVKATVSKVKPARPKIPKAKSEAPAPSAATKSWIEKQAEAARERIKKRGSNQRLNIGLDPIDLADRVIIGASDIAGGLRDFSGWASKQVKEWGEAIKPHLEDIWNRSNVMLTQHSSIASIAEKMKARVADGATLGELRPYVQRISEGVVRSGTTELEPLLDVLHPIVEEIVPGSSRRQTMDLFSGYGEFRPLSKDAIKVQLRDLRGQAQQLGKIDDMQAGTAPRKTGPERRNPSDKERALIKEVENLKRKGGFTVTDSETQLRTAMEAVKTRLRNQLKDMATLLDTGERPANREALKYDAEAENLRAIRDRVKQTLDDLQDKPGVSEEQRIKAAGDAIQRSIDEYNRRLNEDDYAPREKKPGISTPELDALRAQRDALKAEYAELRELDDAVARQRADKREGDLQAQIDELDRRLRTGDLTPAGSERAGEPTLTAENLAAQRDAMQKQLGDLRRDAARPVLTDAEKEAAAQKRMLAAFKTRAAGRIAKLTAKLAAGDFSGAPPRRTLSLDSEGLKAKADLQRIKDDYERGLIRDRLSKRGTFERTLDGAAKWRRAFVLSGVHTLAKLTSAATEIIGIAPIEEAVGGALGVLPGVRAVAVKAARHGGLSVRAEVEAITANVTRLFSDAATYMKKGELDIDTVFGDAHLYPFEWKELIGRMHGALKTPARRNEWTRSFRKRMEHAARNGVDVTDPIVQTKLGLDAYKDANRSIFMKSNLVVDAYNRALTRFSEADKNTGHPTVGGKVLETGLKFLLPVVRIPTNIVARTFEYSFGTVTGSARLASALCRGIDNLPPEQADLIMQNLKRGSLGAAVLLIGFLNPENVGGYYSGKRDEKDVHEGELRIFGTNIPKYLIHNPLLEQLQLGATVRRVMDSKLRKKDEETQGLWAGIWAAGMGLVEEVPFVSQMIRQAKAFTPNGQASYVGELAKSLVPQGIQEAATLEEKLTLGTNPRRAPVTTMDSVRLAVPGLRRDVPLKKK